jgi:cytochrome c553
MASMKTPVVRHFGQSFPGRTRLLAGAAILLLSALSWAAPPARDEYESVLVRTPDRLHGETLFGNCARCHGAAGAGAQDGSVPAIAGQHFRVLARQLVDYRHDKRWDARMEHFADTPYVIATQDVADVADYISSLKRAGPGVAGDGEQLEHGARVYAQRCAGCHGPQGEGDKFKAYPRLAGQHYPYLLRQFHDAVEGRRPNFSPAHVRLLARLNRDDYVGMADYLSRITPPPSIAVTATTLGISTHPLP